MRITTAICLIICLFSIQSLFATGGNPHFGGRSAAMGNASIALKDLWAIKHNQAGLAFLKKAEAGLAYESKFSLKELATKAAVVAVPIEVGTFGLNLSQFGYSQYNENKFGVAFAKKLSSKFAIGVQLNYQYIQFQESEYGRKGFITGEVGFMADISENLTIGAHIFNPGFVKVAEFDDERIPIIMRLGGNYKFSDKFKTLFEIEKDIQHNAEIKLGGEYQAHKKIYLRAGVSTEPFQNSFGIGFNHSNLKIDIAAAYHSTLGYSPNISLTYSIK